MIRGLILFVAFFSCFTMQARFLLSHRYSILCLLEEYNGKQISEEKTVTLEIEAFGELIYSIKCEEIGLNYSMNNVKGSPSITDYKTNYVADLTDGSKETFMKLTLKLGDYLLDYFRPLKSAFVAHSLAVYIPVDNVTYKKKASLRPVNASIYNEDKKEWERIQFFMGVGYKEDLIYKFLYRTGMKEEMNNNGNADDYIDSKIVVN